LDDEPNHNTNKWLEITSSIRLKLFEVPGLDLVWRIIQQSQATGRLASIDVTILWQDGLTMSLNLWEIDSEQQKDFPNSTLRRNLLGKN